MLWVKKVFTVFLKIGIIQWCFCDQLMALKIDGDGISVLQPKE